MYQTERLSACDKCQRSSLVCDLFPQPFRLLLPDGEDKYRTFAGTLLSIASVVIVLSYTVFHFIGLMNNSEYLV